MPALSIPHSSSLLLIHLYSILFLEGLQYLSIVSEQLDVTIKEIMSNLSKDIDIHYLANC